MAEDYILKPTGLYNPALRFAFTNITDKDFTSYWAGQPITVKKGQSIELPHHLAVKLTREMVDQIMLGQAKEDEITYYKNNPNTAPNTYRSPRGTSYGIPAARRPLEDKICRLMETDEESPDIQLIRAQLTEEIRSNMNQEASREPVPIPTDSSNARDPGAKVPSAQFADLDVREKVEVKKPMRTKTVKTP